MTDTVTKLMGLIDDHARGYYWSRFEEDEVSRKAVEAELTKSLTQAYEAGRKSEQALWMLTTISQEIDEIARTK